MIRATICLYQMLASVVGPGLCCCTSLRLMATRCRGGSESFDECPTKHAHKQICHACHNQLSATAIAGLPSVQN